MCGGGRVVRERLETVGRGLFLVGGGHFALQGTKFRSPEDLNWLVEDLL